MDKKEAIEVIEQDIPCEHDTDLIEALEMAIKALDQEPCEMTAEEYRQRMIQAFHNADTDELIAICVLPTEKEFEHLEWLLKNHYKKEPCGDAIDRAEAIKIASGYCHPANVAKELAKLPPVNPTKTGHCKDCKWWKDSDGTYCRGVHAESKCPTKIPIGVFEKLISQELIPDKIKNENVKLCKELKKARKEKKRWKKKYIELRDGKKSIELARIEDGLGLEPILYR